MHNFDDPSAHIGGRQRFVAGSLGTPPNPEFDGQFEVVFGNPPWTPLSMQGESKIEKAADRKRIKALNDQFTTLGRTVLLANPKLDQLAKTYVNPHNASDLPFVWRAMRWAKPGGILGFTLDARLILMQRGTFRAAREALIQACTVTGILNGSSLEKTAVWPGVDKPFIAFFARNDAPLPGHSFVLATPIRENALSNRGEFRLDYTTAQTVTVADVLRYPWLLKTLTVGTSLDVEVVEKLHLAFGGNTVGKTWDASLVSGKGFNLNPRDVDRKAPIWLQNLPFFEVPADGTFPHFEG